jgi:two-component system, LuxR family, response regulator TtrR
MKPAGETVFVIDDDESVRSSLSLFLQLSNYNVESFESSEEYLSREDYLRAGCIILDVNMAGKSGLELQEVLISRNTHLPIIFITGYGNIHMSVDTVKKGAVNYLEKPFNEEELLHSVSEAVALSHKLLAEKEDILKAKKLIHTLTSREDEILTYIITGMLNKQIANKLNIGEHTVKVHRRSICEKLSVKSVPEIIRIADKAGIIPSENKI